MAAPKREEFDVLTFFITVMAVLTVTVSGFAVWNWRKLSKAEDQVKAELRKLDMMQKMAKAEDFRTWLAKDRESKTSGGGSPSDFTNLVLNGLTRNGMAQKHEGINQQSARKLRSGAVELTYRISLKDVRVESVVRWLVGVEEGWPGARTRQIVKLDFNERSEAWDVVVDLSIFSSEAS